MSQLLADLQQNLTFVLVSALIVAVFLSVPYWKGKYFSKSKKGGAVRA